MLEKMNKIYYVYDDIGPHFMAQKKYISKVYTKNRIFSKIC